MTLPGFMEPMRGMTAESGIVLIFDKALTGLRVGLGGAQGLLRAQLDMPVLATAVAAGGFPLAAFGGRKEMMDLIGSGTTIHGSTHNSNPIATKAVLGTIDELSRGFYERMDTVARWPADG